jgi:hypothetical protein
MFLGNVKTSKPAQILQLLVFKNAFAPAEITQAYVSVDKYERIIMKNGKVRRGMKVSNQHLSNSLERLRKTCTNLTEDRLVLREHKSKRYR